MSAAAAASPSLAPGGDRLLLRLAGPALAAAVWVLGVFPPHMRPAYVVQLTAAVVGLIALELAAPAREAPVWRRMAWLLLELGLAFAVVRTQTSLTRMSLIYLLPASRALLMFGTGAGLPASLSVWLVYGANVALSLFPAKLHEFPNYFSFFLAPYVLSVVLTLALLRQGADRE